MNRFFLALLAFSSPLFAQGDWPAKPVTLINPFAAASAVDVVTRLVAQQLTHDIGKSFLVENRTGASGNIGTEAAAKAKPDGYTFLVGSPGSMAINPYLFRKLPYDAEKDFAAVTTLAAFPQVLIVNPKVPVHNLPELVAWVKANPGKTNHASSGTGSTAHLVMELIKADAGLKITHVPFRGGSPATQAVISGDVEMAVEGLPSLPAFIKAGSVRPIAVTSLHRAPSLPNVQAVSETIKDFDAAAWIILFAPAATPPAIVERMSQEVGKALAAPEVKAKLADMGATGVGGTPAETAAYHKREMAKFKRAVEISGATAD
jgi:tripartite-type tricarboxylate transporter receptor subunit TctC